MSVCLHPWMHCDIKCWSCDGESSRCSAEPHSCQTAWVTAPGLNNSVSLSLSFSLPNNVGAALAAAGLAPSHGAAPHMGNWFVSLAADAHATRDKRSGCLWMFSLWQHCARMCLCVKSHVGKDYMCFFRLLLLNMLHISMRSIKGGDLLFPKSHINRCGHTAGWLHETHCRLKNFVVNLNLGSTIAAGIQLKSISRTFNWRVGNFFFF